MNQRPKNLDYYLSNFRFYRKLRKCIWYKHQFTNDASELSSTFIGTWWALYDKINRYSDIVKIEDYRRHNIQ